MQYRMSILKLFVFYKYNEVEISQIIAEKRTNFLFFSIKAGALLFYSVGSKVYIITKGQKESSKKRNYLYALIGPGSFHLI